MRKLALIFGLLFAAIPAFGQAGAGNPLFGISNDGTRHIPSDWATHNNPGYGSTYVDSLGGLKVCQMTDSVADGLTYNLHYATQNPINSGDQYAFVTDTASAADWQIRATGFNGTTCGQVIVPVANMPTRNTHGEMVWDHIYSTGFPWYSDAVNPLKFFYTNGDQLMSGTITGLPGCAATHNCTVTTAVVHTFSAYAGGMASIIDSSDIQMVCSSTCTNDHLPMVGQATLGGHIDVFNYYFASDTISAVYTTTCSASVDAQNNSCIHKLTTNSVGVVIQFASSGWGTELGQWEWGTPFSSLGPQLDDGHSHTDGGADLSGNPIEMKEGPTPTTGPGAQNGNCPSSPNTGIIVQNPTSFTSPMTCLVDYDFLDVEVGYTGTSQNPWMVLSDESDASTAESFTNSACFAAPTSANWKPYQSEVVFARVDAANNLTKVYRMLWMYSRANECSGVSNFQAVPKGVGSQDRNVILFNSTMGYQSGTCGQGCINVYSAFAPTGTIFTAPGSPAVSLSPTSLSFGNQIVSTTSPQQVVTLTNTGTAPLTISSVALTTGTQFAFATPGSGSDCRTVGTVAASGTCNIAVTFTPTSAGAQSDTVSITDNAAGSPHTFGVSGTGIAAGGRSTMNGGVSINGGMVSN